MQITICHTVTSFVILVTCGNLKWYANLRVASIPPFNACTSSTICIVDYYWIKYVGTLHILIIFLNLCDIRNLHEPIRNNNLYHDILYYIHTLNVATRSYDDSRKFHIKLLLSRFTIFNFKNAFDYASTSRLRL